MRAGVGVTRLPDLHTRAHRIHMLTPEDEQLITRAILGAMKVWSLGVFLIMVVVWLLWFIVGSVGGVE